MTEPVTPCVLCGALSRRLVVELPDLEYAAVPGTFRIVECAGCQHQFVDPLPAPHEVPLLYPDTYYTWNLRSPLYFKGVVKVLKERQEVRHTVALAGKEPPRSILEVGAGSGKRLAALRSAWSPAPRCVGVDLGTERTRDAARAAGVELHEANIDESLDCLGERRFDLILMSQVIEHLRDPVAALRRLATHLEPNGRVIIETPNRAGLDYLLFKDRDWGGYHAPRHFHLFTRQSLRHAVELSGLRVADAACVTSAGLWIMSLRNRLGLSSAHSSRSAFELLNFSNLPTVAAFSVVDHLCLLLGRETSNQFAVAVHP